MGALWLCLLLAPAPWWDDLPTFVQTGDVERAVRVGAAAVLCGAADDPTWGLYAQRVRLHDAGDRVARLHAAGLKALCWIEGFGTAGSVYIAQLKREPDGSWVKYPGTDLTRVFLNHWAWQKFDGTGESRWLGVHNWFADEEFARPYTRTHPRYGGPPLTWPDGTVADGYATPGEPRSHRVWDAGCAKDVWGRVTWDYGFNAQVNRLDPATGRPAGPIAGLVEAGEVTGGVPDPGFTPEQWAQLKRQRYAGTISPGKDALCPAWIEYARASVRSILDAGLDGLWIDNFSPWDSFHARPLVKAFGDWSVAGFRDWLRQRDPATPPDFDVRAYLRDTCATWGGDPADLRDPRWRDPRWREDPLWRAFLVFKRQSGTAALDRLDQALHDEARAAGKPAFLTLGNDIPIFGLGWVRDNLDQVSTELNWGWGLTTGPRGLMPPPYGSYAPVYRLAREHTRSRFVNAWLYAPPEQLNKPGVADALYYQALASQASPMPHYPGRCVGTEAGDAAFHAFADEVRPHFRDRRATAEVGLYFSSSSQLLELLPGGFRDHADQPHSFSFYGWGTALDWLHLPWRAIPEWRLTPATLAELKVLIIASSEVFPPEDAAVLRAWLQAGGRLLVAGPGGARGGEEELFAPQPSPLDGLPGQVLRLPDDPGLAFYRAAETRPALLAAVAAPLARLLPPTERWLTAPDAPWTVGLTPYRAGPRRIIVDVNNTDLDLATDTLHPSPPVSFHLAEPGRWRLSVVSPDPVEGQLSATAGRLTVALGPIPRYAAAILDAE